MALRIAGSIAVLVALAGCLTSLVRAQALPASERGPRVLLLPIEVGSNVSQRAMDTVDDELEALPAMATWARPSSSCDPAPMDVLGGGPRCLASSECVRRVARRCAADVIVTASVAQASTGGDGVDVVLRVIEGRRGVTTVEERLTADTPNALARLVRAGIERIAAGGWLAGTLEVRGPSSGMGVRVDGHDAGIAPVTVSRLAPGYHQIELLAEGRVVYLGEVEVESGVTSVVRATSTARADRYVVSVVRRDPSPDRATAFAPTDVALRNPGTIALSTPTTDAPTVRPTGVGFVVFEDRDARRDVLLGRGRVSPTYHRGGVGAALRFDFQ